MKRTNTHTQHSESPYLHLILRVRRVKTLCESIWRFFLRFGHLDLVFGNWLLFVYYYYYYLFGFLLLFVAIVLNLFTYCRCCCCGDGGVGNGVSTFSWLGFILLPWLCMLVHAAACLFWFISVTFALFCNKNINF